jgi:hypothetical protein
MDNKDGAAGFDCYLKNKELHFYEMRNYIRDSFLNSKLKAPSVDKLAISRQIKAQEKAGKQPKTSQKMRLPQPSQAFEEREQKGIEGAKEYVSEEITEE